MSKVNCAQGCPNVASGILCKNLVGRRSIVWTDKNVIIIGIAWCTDVAVNVNNTILLYGVNTIFQLIDLYEMHIQIYNNQFLHFSRQNKIS